MDILTVFTQLAENAHHQNVIDQLKQDQSAAIIEVLKADTNSKLKNMLTGTAVDFPDRDKVVTIDRL